ncbi:MAG TPA: UpxY family transcription antiterminator [Candidatus Acidoferrales bacterium]|jgi:transcription antitermination factor NusG|nr:UpxY family transcription antiterminator [Candidatus Acidoferrales bacterium]
MRPILKSECDTEKVSRPDSGVGDPWFALQVRTRHESGVANYLVGQGYESFLPLYKCRKRWSDRVKEVQTPLFPGYLFCRFDPQDRLPIMKTPGVMQIVGVNRVPIPVDEVEISAIQTLVASGIPNQPWPFLQVGERVRIESGSLSGLEGILMDFKGTQRLVLSITLLQRSVSVEIDSAFVSSTASSQRSRLEKTYVECRPVQIVT